MARVQETYAKEIAPALMKKFNYKSVMQIPKLDKVVINVGCGEARDNPKIMDAILSDQMCIRDSPEAVQQDGRGSYEPAAPRRR